MTDLHATTDVYRFPASYSQKAIWFIEQSNPGIRAYELVNGVELSGALDMVALEDSIRRVTNRHDVLRCTFAEVDGDLWQMVSPVVEPELQVETVQSLTDAQQRLAVFTQQRFDLQGSLLFQSIVVRIADAAEGEPDALIAFKFHHIIVDQVSVGVVTDEIGQCYAALRRGQDPAFAVQNLDYADFVVWQQENVTRETTASKLAFWRDRIVEPAGCINLPLDRPRPKRQSFTGDEVRRALESGLSAQVREFSARHSVSPFTTLLTAYALVLGRYAQQDRVVVGVPFGNRGADEALESVVGLFINTLPIPIALNPDLSFLQQVEAIGQLIVSAQANQDVPLEHILEAVPLERDPSYNPLFQVGFSLQPPPSVLQLAGTECTDLRMHPSASPYDMQLWVLDPGIPGDLEFQIWFDDSLYDRSTIEQFLKALETLLVNGMGAPAQVVSAIPIVESDYQILVGPSLPPDRNAVTLPALLDLEHRTPSKTAVQTTHASQTYQHLREQADRISAVLQAMGAASGTRVGILLAREQFLVPALVGTVQAGAAYVPLDPAYPESLLQYVIEDASLTVVLTTSDLQQLAQSNGQAKVLCLDTISERGTDAAFVKPQISAEDPAYVIYTSGSTGKPKGVEVPHGAATNMLRSIIAQPGIDQDDRLLAVTTLSFDISVVELFAPLAVGAQIVLATSEQSRDVTQLTSLLDAHNISILQATPSTWQLLLQAKYWPKTRLRAFCGGEPMSFELASGLLPRVESLWNMYGPTETAVYATIAEVTDPAYIRIGQPVANVAAYVLDRLGNHVPDGVPGELYIGGAGLALGYLNLPQLTQDCFVPHPQRPEERIYRTGDLVRIDGHRQIEHLGRLDHQIKIRGFRVELEHVEQVMNAFSGVSESVAHTHLVAPDDLRLVLYPVVPDTVSADVDAMRSHLKAELPDYMVPQFVIPVAAIPRTPNGKTDRTALPAPDAIPNGHDFEPPASQVEHRIAAIWQSLIGVERIGRHDDFYQLGGHSLLLTRAAIACVEAFDSGVALSELLQEPTISHWATCLQGSDEGVAMKIACFDRASTGASYQIPTTYSQRALWYVAHTNPSAATYDLPFAFALHGSLDPELFRGALTQVVADNEVLRAHFAVSGGEVIQLVDQQASSLGLEFHSAESAEDVQTTIRQALEQRFDLSTGPLYRVLVITESQSQVTTIVLRFHHIIADHTTIQLFVSQLEAAYSAQVNGTLLTLDSNRIDFGDYAAWQAQTKTREQLAEQLTLWTETITEPVGCITLPTDHPRPAVQSFQGQHIREEMPAGLWQDVCAYSRAAGVSPFATALAAYSLLLSRLARQERVIVGVPFANRNEDVRLDDVLGLFINTLPCAITVDDANTFGDLVQTVHQLSQAMLERQGVPLEHIVDALPVVRDSAYSPLFQVGLSMQEQLSNLRFADLQSAPVDVPMHTSMFDLHLWIVQHVNGGAHVLLNFDDALFEPESARRMLDQFYQALRIGLEQSSAPLERLSLVNEAVAGIDGPQRLLRSEELTLPDLLANRCNDLEHIALVHTDVELTYRQLFSRSQVVACHLGSLGLEQGDRVGILLERNLDLLPSLLGVLMAGMAYVPLDPTYPEELLAYVIQDADLTGIISTQRLSATIASNYTGQVISVECISSAAATAASYEAPTISPDAPAYVIYTSGSTGRSKGVVVPHRAVTNFLTSMVETPGLSVTDRLVAVTTTSFDISVLELFGPLVAGASVVLASHEQARDSALLAKLIAGSGATIMQATPSTWRLLVEQGADFPPGFRALIGGETLPPDLAEALMPEVSALWNLYGPTETTVWSTVFQVTNADAIRIGLPIGNTQLYILDPHGNAVPQGAPGELCIGGDGVALGYHKRPELTAERFVDHPQRPGTRIYRTGDLVRACNDGALKHMGRLDHQVKIRGFRVELGHIEASLLGCDGVAEALVHAKEVASGDQRLIAYVVGESNQTLAVSTLRKSLRKQLPDYMIPQFFVVLDAIPRTPNGKTDRNALPDPVQSKRADRSDPEGALETAIAAVWARLIGTASINRFDSFFESGGHSLLAVRAIAEIEAETGLAVDFRAVTSLSLADMCQQLSVAGDVSQPVATREPEKRGLLARVRRIFQG